MDTFKGQDNDVILDLCEKHMCQVVIVPHNLTNKFQPLDIRTKRTKSIFLKLGSLIHHFKNGLLAIKSKLEQDVLFAVKL